MMPLTATYSLQQNFEADSELQELLAKKSESPNRRRHQRCLFQHYQLIAPFDGENMPGAEAFRSVLCQDLSQSGLSYFSPIAPQSRYVVIALGKVPFRFMLSEVVRAEPTSRGLGQYLVGCRFLGKLAADATVERDESAEG